MKPIRCRDKQCRTPIAYIGGSHKYIDCPKCGKRQKVYGGKGFRVKVEVENLARR